MKKKSLTHVSLFSGIGGIDLAAEWAGFRKVLFCEKDKYCQKVLRKHWPDVPIVEEIRDDIRQSATIISGGDPCPIRSRARNIWGTKHPDLSGYFLATVGRCRPRWVVRENVPAPDVIDFETALDVLGYRNVIITSNAFPYTGQNRTREFVVGCIKETWMRRFCELYIQQSNTRIAEAGSQKTEGYPCLTTHRYRYDSRDGYIWDGTGRLRVADAEERTALAGFPIGWLDGLSYSQMARVTGNAVVPQQVYPILKAIIKIEKSYEEEA